MTDRGFRAVDAYRGPDGRRSTARLDRIKRRVIYPLLKQIPIWISLLVTLFPIYFVVMTALKTQDEYVSNKLWPSASPTVVNFGTVSRSRTFQYGSETAW